MANPAAKFMLILAATLGTSVALAGQRAFDKRLDAPAGGQLTFDADVGSVASEISRLLPSATVTDSASLASGTVI